MYLLDVGPITTQDIQKKTSQSYKHRKVTWWIGSHPRHYIVSNVEPTQHDGTKELQQENIVEAIQEIKEPLDAEPPLEVSAATLGILTKSLGETTLGPYTTASLDLSHWKLVTKNISGASTVPQESGGHKGTHQLIFGTLKLPALNKVAQFLLEKRGKTETCGKYMDKAKWGKNMNDE